MSTTEQKLQKIEKLILQKANEKADDLIFKAMTQKNELLEKKEIEVLQIKYKEINKESMEIRRKTTQYIADYEIKNKRKLLLAREDFSNRIFEAVFVKLCNFTKKVEYEKMFSKKLNKIKEKNESNIEFHIKPLDKTLTNVIIDIFGNDSIIEEDSDIKIGGFKIVYQNTGKCLDETLDSKLLEQKTWFYSNSNLLSF